MLFVHGQGKIDPSIRDRWLKSCAIAGPLSRKEDGNELYVYAADVLDPSSVHIFELWRDRAALDAHIRAPHHVTRVNELREMNCYWPSVQFYEATPVPRFLDK